MSVELVIFDCDGVLFESERANIAFYNAVLASVGEPPVPEHAVGDCHALASAQLFARHYGDRPELMALLQRTARTTDYGPFFELMEPRPGLTRVLGELRRDYRTAMATNRGKTVDDILERWQLGDLFDLAVGVFHVERPKPHPDMLLYCLERFGVDPSSAVYVGDQRGDAEAAAAAGMRFIGMAPIAAESELSIGSLDELGAKLRGL